MLATGGISGGASSSLFWTDAFPRRAILRVEETRNESSRRFSSLDRALLHKHRTDFSSEREPNRSLNDPCRTSPRLREGGGGSIPLDPNNNRSWNGLHLDSPAANNRKNGGIFNYRAKYLFRIVIPFLLEIYFLGWINYSIRIRSYIRFYSSRSKSS